MKKWLKKLQFWKRNKKNQYPTAEQVQEMVKQYKQVISPLKRDSKGRWIMPNGDAVSTARFETYINQKWEQNKETLNPEKKCKCQGKGGCKCKKI